MAVRVDFEIVAERNQHLLNVSLDHELDRSLCDVLVRVQRIHANEIDLQQSHGLHRNRLPLT